MKLSLPRRAWWLLAAGLIPLINCGDYSKAQTTCTITKKLILINADHRRYVVTCADSSQSWTTDSTSLQTFTEPRFTYPATADTLDSLSRDTLELSASWTINHHTPWDHEICIQDQFVLRLAVTLTKLLNDTATATVLHYLDTVNCEGCTPSFTEADSMSTDSLQQQAESYECIDSLRIDQP